MIAENSKCSYCKNAKETIIHLFNDCPHLKEVWNALKKKISIDLPNLTPKSAFFVFFWKLQSLITGNCNANYVINKIAQIKKTEKNIVYINEKARKKNEKNGLIIEFYK